MLTKVCAPLALLALLLSAACAPDAPDQPTQAPLALVTDDDTRPTFIVRFTGSHPLARAQALEAAGDHVAAAELAGNTLAHDASFAGLCFDRFTLGGAETVLAACARLTPEAARLFADDWTLRLQRMPGVAYAEENYSAGTTS